MSGPASGRDALLRDGYRFVVPVDTDEPDFDAQGHLNNAAVARLCNDMRIAYARDGLGAEWLAMLRDGGYVVAAREVHLLYESEGLPGERFVGGVRYVRREGKAAIVEQRIVEARTGRAVARAWVVQLLARDGRAVAWPDRFFELVARVDGRPVETAPRRPTPPWGPPPPHG